MGTSQWEDGGCFLFERVRRCGGAVGGAGAVRHWTAP
jgi:hypothetical protein